MVRLGQHFLADPNLLDAIVREADPDPGDVVLEVGAGEGALTERLADRVRHLHAVELDRLLVETLAGLASRPGVTVHRGDAMSLDLAALEPEPTAVVANLPYSIATPLLIGTVTGLPGISRWTVMVQLEIAERLSATPGSRLYGSPTVVIQWGCDVRMLRRVDRAVFRPRPRVDSALVAISRTGPPPDGFEHALIRDCFAHRRKSLARSLELRRPGTIAETRAALGEAGLSEAVRAEAVTVEGFRSLARLLRPRIGERSEPAGGRG